MHHILGESMKCSSKTDTVFGIRTSKLENKNKYWTSFSKAVLSLTKIIQKSLLKLKLTDKKKICKANLAKNFPFSFSLTLVQYLTELKIN